MTIRSKLVLLALIAIISFPSAAFAGRPSGAVKLARAKLIKKTGFYCGNVRGSSWLPGKLIPGGFFYSHQAEKINLTKALSRASKSKKKKIQAQIKVLNGLIAARASQCAGGGGAKKGRLRFDFSGAVGLTLKSTTRAQSVGVEPNNGLAAQATSSSNLQKIDGSGAVSSAVSSGSAVISSFLIAPNDKLYVLFAQRVNLNDTTQPDPATGCLLAEVDKTTGSPVCIDNTLREISWSERPRNNAIQFDASGAIYYTGYNSSNKRVLRRNVSGTITDLINDNIELNDFLILPDGRALVAGATSSSEAQWLRRINPNGSLTNLYTGSYTTFLQMFPDGNVYIGSDGFTGFGYGINMYLPESDSVDPRPYIGFDELNPYFSPSLICDGINDLFGFCGGANGAIVKGFHRSISQKVFGVAGDGTRGTLTQYYPTLERPVTEVTRISTFQGVINQLILAGLNAQNKNILTLFDTSDGSEIQLLGPDNEIEIYHLNYVASSNKIMFDGLRFSDNKYVIGQYDLNTMTFSASQTGSSKLVDFQTF